MKTFVPQIKRQKICSNCGKPKKHYNHLPPSDHKFKPRTETVEEAYFRAGYEQGSKETDSRWHWGGGWD